MEQSIASLVKAWTIDLMKMNDSEECSLPVESNENPTPQMPIPAQAWSLLCASCGWIGSTMKGSSIPTPLDFTPNHHSIGVYLLGTSLAILVVVTLLFMLRLLLQRHQARSKLQQCGLPVVYWRPKAMFRGSFSSSYDAPSSSSHASSALLLRPSNITNILPRMERLKGPYGMYGTVYGISTAVVHVAHPVPAAAILSSTVGTTTSPPVVSKLPNNGTRRSSSRGSGVATSSGATKSPAYDHFKNFCGNGVFTADGDEWKQKRAAVLHVLMRSCSAVAGSDGAPANFEAKVERNAHDAATRLVEYLEQCIDTEEGSNSSSRKLYKVNVVPLLQWTTLGLIYRYLTHQELQSDVDWRQQPLKGDGATNESVNERNGRVVCGDSGREPNGLLSRYLDSITRIRMIVLAQSRSVWFLLPRWYYRTFSRMYRDEERTMGPIRMFSEQACLEALPGSPLHILSRHFAPYCHPDDSPTVKSSWQGEATDPVSKHLLDEAITLLFAGQDTSAATLSWTLHLLSLYPAIQDKLAVEIATALPLDDERTCSVPLTRKVLMQLPYLDAIVKESMRLYPVAPFVVRRLPCDVPVRDPDSQDGTSRQMPLSLPKDSFACIWIYALHRNEAFWSCPNEFWPERWLVESGPDRDAGISNGAYMPFAAGPRNCVGQPMANIILRSLLARLIDRFRFEDPRLIGLDETPAKADALRKDMQAGFTVLPEGGVDLCITRRSRAA
jgi:Cytochrome P450